MFYTTKFIVSIQSIQCSTLALPCLSSTPSFKIHVALEVFSLAGDIKALVEVQVLPWECTCAQSRADSIQWANHLRRVFSLLVASDHMGWW